MIPYSHWYIQYWFIHNPFILIFLGLYRNCFCLYSLGLFLIKKPIFLFCINSYHFLIIGILWQVNVRSFSDPSFPNISIRIDPNNWILGNILVLILKNVINIATWTSGCIKFTDRIIISSYWSCTWTHFASSNESTSSPPILAFILSPSQISFFSFTNDIFPSFMCIITIFTCWTFSICYFMSIFVVNFCIISILIIYYVLVLFNLYIFLVIKFIIYTFLHNIGGGCHMVILLLPASRYPNYFILHFLKYLCILHLHFHSMLLLLSIHHLNHLGIILLSF